MTDLSDSLHDELVNLITAQGQRALVELFILYQGHGPLGRLPDRQRVNYQLYGGEDYSLLITVPGDKTRTFLRRYPKNLAPPRCIGVVGCGRGGLDLRYENKPWRGRAAGFRHF